MKSNKNIVLIGMMGSGKSSIGKILSKKLNLTFIDIDQKIEENDSEYKNSADNNLSVDEKEEFSAEESESSQIDEEFNQETEEELLDIPTFLRRQAN